MRCSNSPRPLTSVQEAFWRVAVKGHDRSGVQGSLCLEGIQLLLQPLSPVQRLVNLQLQRLQGDLQAGLYQVSLPHVA